MTSLSAWLPPVLWMAAIMWFSSATFSAARTGSILEPLLAGLAPWLGPSGVALLHAAVRKGAHLTTYAILAALWLRALVQGRSLRPRPAAWIALSVSLLWAFLDEAHQATVPERTASAADVAIDGVGALVALGVAPRGWRQSLDLATGALLWIAAAGGTAALLLNVSAGVSPGVLWLTVPAAALALLVRRLWRGGD